MRNETIDKLLKRRTIRNFKDQEISEEDLDLIKQAIKRSPTAGNMQDYFVIIVKEQERRQKLAYLCDNQPLISKSPMSLIFVTDITKHMRLFTDIGIDLKAANLPKSAHLFNSIINTTIATQSAALACEALNIGTCYIGDIIEHKKEIKELLNLDKYQIPVTMLSIGYYQEQELKKQSPRNDDKFYFYDEKYDKPDITELRALFDKPIPKKFQQQYSSYIEYEYNRKTNTDFSKKCLIVSISI